MARLLKYILFLASLAICTDAAAILLSLLKELQKQSAAISHLGSISGQWCSDAQNQELMMVQVIQGQLDDATIAVQQIKSDEKRLDSELTLARSTQHQREQQLQDASSTSNFAAVEFTSEQSQLNQTIEACQNGARLLKAQMKMDVNEQEQLGRADIIASSLLQSSSDHMTDDEKNIMTQYASGPKPDQVGNSGERPQVLLQTLTQLLARLQKEQSRTFAEHQVLALRLWSFTDRLSSSIMESKSQTAAISMEMAQRKRERVRLDGKIAALNALRSKIDSSKQAVTSSCSLEADRKTELEKYIAEESDSVRATLKKMPALSSELLFDLSTVLPAAPAFPSFLQLRGGRRKGHKAAGKLRNVIDPILKDLESIASKFPEDSASFVEAKRTLMAHKAPEAKQQLKQAPKQGDSIKGFASSSIQDIYAFLKSDSQGGGGPLPGEEMMLLSNSGDLKRVATVYGDLLDHVHTQERTVDDQLKWCGSIARDAKVDADAVSRSLKWTDAKLNLIHVAMSEHDRVVSFNKAQQETYATKLTQLQKLADVEDSQLAQSYGTLKAYAQQLMSLVTELEQKSSAEERKGADVVKTLLDKVEKHQGMLQSWRIQSRDRREAVSSELKAVQQTLADGAKRSTRRLVRLKVESQVLTSLVSSKAKDKQLSEKYRTLSQELCSVGKAKDLQAKAAKLRAEAAAIQKSLTALSQPAATA